MPRKKKNGDQPIGVGLTSKQMKRKKPINADMLRDVEALTDNQKALFDSYSKNKNLVAYGAAGTGKTFITLYNVILIQIIITIQCFLVLYLMLMRLSNK